MNIVVVGIGNILFKDEGIGVYAGKYLEENYTFEPAVDFVDGGTLGFKLMTYYHSYDKVMVLDTVSVDDAAGSVCRLSAQEFMDLGTQRNTAHEVEVVEMLEICSLLDTMAEVNVIGIVPEDIESVEIAMTESMHRNFPAMIAAAIAELESTGITVRPKPAYLSLEEVIRSYNEPTCAVPA